MGEDKYYSIGEVSEICKISKKALRFYDKIGLVSPDYIDQENHYRFYSRKTLLFFPIIKYYKQMGFKLEEMKKFLFSQETYMFHINGFEDKIKEIIEIQEQMNVSYKSIKDWQEMLFEAENVLRTGYTGVSVKYIKPEKVIYMDQEFEFNYMESIINIEWTNYLDSINQAITGPVMIRFSSIEDKINAKKTKVKVFQEMIGSLSGEKQMTCFGDFFASCYHIGPHNSLNETYDKILKWIGENGYKVQGEVIERYLTDYWASNNAETFVTEVIVSIEKAR